jgi:hypothetical protein
MALELESDKDGTPLVPIEQDARLIENSINAAVALVFILPFPSSIYGCI